MKNNLVLVFSKLCISFSYTFHLWITVSPFTKSTTSSFQDERLVMRLIHRDSVLSPVYDKSSTISDRANFALKSSRERVRHLKAKTSGAFVPYIEGILVPNVAATIFFLNVSVGEPPVPQLLVVDTGSNLLWVQCVPCTTCRRTTNPTYIPKKSSSYAPISCHPKACAEYFDGHCNSDGYCAYSIRYKDGTNSSGIMAYEKFTFRTHYKGTVVAHSVIFGCGSKNTDKIVESNGVFGLNADNGSALSSIGSKFSYCIGNISDPNYLHNFLIMGDGAIIEGSLSPFQVRHGLYWVTLEGFTVNQKKIIANPKEFKFRVIFDSGSTLPHLGRSIYEPFKWQVKSLVDKSFPSWRPVKFRNRPDLLCYEGNLNTVAVGFPTITMHLAGKTDIEMNGENLFFQAQPDAFCMAIEAQDDGINIIGVIGQQYSNIGFDLEANHMSYRSADCEFVSSFFSSDNQ